jgi:U3 small nucleolar RNA-associated protein 19
LFLPPPTRENHPHDDDGNDDDERNNDDEYDEDDDETSSSSDNESNDESNHPSKKRKISSATISTTTTKDKVYSWQSITKHRSALQQSHLALLKINVLPPRSLKRILTHLPINVLPHISSPLRFADFCTSAYEMGGLTSIHALHSLFILMTEHGLEYKAFYESLYNVVSIRMFYVKYRIRFFKLLIQCLCGNSMLPTYLIAAFCKKLLRCCINGPPSGILFVVALVSNLIRKHKEVACIIHRIPSSDQTMDDPYAEGEKDPSKSRAIESSLWELNALEHHYHPAVRLLAKECGKEDEKTLLHDLDGFLLHTYKSLFEQERKREMTKKRSGSTVPLTFKEPKGLFVKEDIFDGIADFPQHE